MQEINVWYVEHWDEMKAAVVSTPLKELDLWQFLWGSGAEFPSDNFRYFVDFLRSLEAISWLADPETRAYLDSVFHIAFNQGIIGHSKRQEARSSYGNGANDLGVDFLNWDRAGEQWYGVSAALSPARVQEMAKTAQKSSFEIARPYCEMVQQSHNPYREGLSQETLFASFDDLKEYAQEWVRLVEQGSARGFAILVTIW